MINSSLRCVVRLLGLMFWMTGFAVVVQAAKPSDYQSATVEGWTVRTKADCFEGAPQSDVDDFWAKLRTQLLQVASALPLDKTRRLQAIPVYVHRGEYRPYGCAHHPSRTWLVEHGYPAEMANSVEICNWREFRSLVQTQPWCMLHEYAHAWHFIRPGMSLLIRPAYDSAVRKGLYLSVKRVGMEKPERAYALENEREYFAELSEAYFGRNDFAPFDREELKSYDPVGYAMIQDVWSR